MLYLFYNKIDYIKNVLEIGKNISPFLKNVICLIQETTRVLFYRVFKISIFVTVNYHLIT
ncbi:hypothetical protein GCM10027035_05670 [Emticicia sediminis]